MQRRGLRRRLSAGAFLGNGGGVVEQGFDELLGNSNTILSTVA